MKLWLARILHEPLVQFLAFGGLLFVIFDLGQPDERRIVISSELREHLARELARQQSEPPSEAMLQQALETWKRDEVLYREALGRGLHLDDSIVRQRLIAKMREVEEQLFVPGEPSDAELGAYLERNQERYRVPERYDFEHVFAAEEQPQAKARAESWLAELANGADPRKLGDRFFAGRVLAAKTPHQLAQLFGESFARALPALALGRWTLLASNHGWHVVRLQLAEGGLPDFESLKGRLLQDWFAERSAQAYAQFVDALLLTYDFEEAGP